MLGFNLSYDQFKFVLFNTVKPWDHFINVLWQFYERVTKITKMSPTVQKPNHVTAKFGCVDVYHFTIKTSQHHGLDITKWSHIWKNEESILQHGWYEF